MPIALAGHGTNGRTVSGCQRSHIRQTNLRTPRGFAWMVQCKCGSTQNARFVLELCKKDPHVGEDAGHEAFGDGLSNGIKEKRPRIADTASNQDNLRLEKMDQICDPKSEVAAGLLKHPHAQAVSQACSLCHHLGGDKVRGAHH